MKVILSVLATLFLLATNLKAQPRELNEVIQLSWANPAYTARSIAVGGAFTSLGADISSNFINPAGIGMFRTAEVVYGPNFSFKNTASNYLNNTKNASNLLMELGTFGIVIPTKRTQKKRLTYLNFGLAYHQSNHNNLRRAYSGFNQESCCYIGDYPDLGAQHEENISTKRSRYGEFVFAAAANYQDRFFIGLNLGIPRYTFNQEYRFSEVDVNDSFYLAEINIIENDSIWVVEGGAYIGFGINYKLTDNFRIGVNIKSSSYFTLFEDYVASEIEAYDDGYEINLGSPLEEFEFNLRKPFTANAGISYLNQKGFIAVDVEYQPYTRYEYSDDFNSELNDSSYISTQNYSIRENLRDVFNIKAGGEYVLAQNYRLRAGYQYLMSPLQDNRELSDQHVFSIGGGIRKVVAEYETRKSVFFADVALVFAAYKSRYHPYQFPADYEGNIPPPPIVDFNYIRTNLNTTFGFKF